MRETRPSGLTRGTKDILGPYSTVIVVPEKSLSRSDARLATIARDLPLPRGCESRRMRGLSDLLSQLGDLICQFR